MPREIIITPPNAPDWIEERLKPILNAGSSAYEIEDADGNVLVRFDALSVERVGIRFDDGTNSDPVNASAWKKLLETIGTDLGVPASEWFIARNSILRFLERGQSVNLVVHGRVAWRQLVDDVQRRWPDFARIDLHDPLTASLRGFVREILRAAGTTREVPEGPEALVVLGETLQQRTLTRLALTNFDRASDRYEQLGFDLFAALRSLMMDARKLVLLVESHRPFAELVPRDHEISEVEIKTVELRGKR